MHRRAQRDVGPAIHTHMDDPRVILLGLQCRYGKRAPTEKEEATQQWGRPWNPSEPIENMFFKLEELFIQVVVAGVSYTQAQLLDQTLDKVNRITAIGRYIGQQLHDLAE